MTLIERLEGQANVVGGGEEDLLREAAAHLAKYERLTEAQAARIEELERGINRVKKDEADYRARVADLEEALRAMVKRATEVEHKFSAHDLARAVEAARGLLDTPNTAFSPSPTEEPSK